MFKTLRTSSVRRSRVLQEAPCYYLGDLGITAKPGQELRQEDKAGNGEAHPGLRMYYVDPIAIDERNHIALCCWGIMANALIVQLRGLLGTALCWLYAHVSSFRISFPSFQSTPVGCILEGSPPASDSQWSFYVDSSFVLLWKIEKCYLGGYYPCPLVRFQQNLERKKNL